MTLKTFKENSEYKNGHKDFQKKIKKCSDMMA